MASLRPILRSELTADLLELLLVDGGEWTADGLAGEGSPPSPTVTKEVRRLERAGIVTSRTVGRTKFVTAANAEPTVTALRRALATATDRKGGDDMAKKKKDKKKKK